MGSNLRPLRCKARAPTVPPPCHPYIDDYMYSTIERKAKVCVLTLFVKAGSNPRGLEPRPGNQHTDTVRFSSAEYTLLQS